MDELRKAVADNPPHNPHNNQRKGEKIMAYKRKKD